VSGAPRPMGKGRAITIAVAYLASDESRYMTETVMNMLGCLDLFVL
jgi:hypothetical protein